MFDLGTGLRYFGASQAHDGSFRGSCLLSHLHWDHIQGVPFFTPLLIPGSEFDVYAPEQDDGRTVAEVFAASIRPPLFPVGLDQFPGTFRFHDLADGEFDIGEVHVTARTVPHVGPTLGYRIEWHGRSIVYISDHQQPYDGSLAAPEAVLDLVRGADMLIHDSQYTHDEFLRKSTWGHCTPDYAVWLATICGVRQLVLFHHDPSRTDDQVDAVHRRARAAAEDAGLDVVAAAEGMSIHLP